MKLKLVVSLVGAVASLTAGALAASPRKFVLLGPDTIAVHMFELNAVKGEPDGSRAIDFWSSAPRMVGTPPALYTKVTYSFDCANRLVRLEAMAAYDQNFRPVFTAARRSPWRHVPSIASMPVLFDAACGFPAPSTGAVMEAQSPEEALRTARRHLGWG